MTLETAEIQKYLPLLIPLFAAELGLFLYVLIHILRHDRYKHGNRALWLAVVIVLINFVGPILYLVFGKEDD